VALYSATSPAAKAVTDVAESEGRLNE
jgi:hypothetical protein